MDNRTPFLVHVLTVLITHRKRIFILCSIVGILAVVLSLIVPVWYQGKATILPPSDDDDSFGFSALISQIPLPSSLLGFGGASESASIAMAILQSRTVMDAAVIKFNLEKRYRSKNIESAVRTLRKRCAFEIEEEGTIGVAVMARTSFFHPKKQVDEARRLARDMTNYFIAQLDSVNKVLRTQKARNLRIVLEARYNQNIHDLTHAEDEFRNFQEKYGTISLPEQTLAAIEAAAGLEAEKISKEIEIGVLRQTVGNDHYLLVKSLAELREIEKKYRELDTGKDGMEAGLFPPFKKIPEYGVEYARLYREIKLQELLLEFLLPQYEQAKIQEAKDTPTIQVIDYAVLPIKKVKPKRALIVIFSVLFSLILSTLYFIWIEKVKILRANGSATFKKIEWINTQIRGDIRKLFGRKR